MFSNSKIDKVSFFLCLMENKKKYFKFIQNFDNMKTHLNPSEVSDSYWIYAFDNVLAREYPNKDGKWMMFFPMAQMDERWNEASKLYCMIVTMA